MVHISGHGRVDYFAPAREAFLVGPADDDDENYIVENRNLHQHMVLSPGATVVLSCCGGLLSNLGDVNDLQGISATCLSKGARSVIGGLWPVVDGVARSFIESFYAGFLQPGPSDPVAAVTAAQRALIAAGESVYDWVPFSAIAGR